MVSTVVPQGVTDKLRREDRRWPGMAARSSFVLAVPSTATLFFSSSQLLNQKSAKEHQAMRMQSEEVLQKWETFLKLSGSWTAPEASARRPTSPELAAALTGSDVSCCAKKIPLFLEEPVPTGIVKCWEEQWLQRWWEQAGTAEWWQHGETICISSFPPCEGCSEHAETLKHFARPNHQELIQYPSIPLWTLTKEEKELFCLLPQEIVAFFHAIYLKATFLLHSLSLIRSCNYLAICIPFLSKLVCYIAYKYVFVATRQVCPTVGTCHCLIQIHGLLFCSVYF